MNIGEGAIRRNLVAMDDTHDHLPDKVPDPRGQLLCP